MSFSQKNTLANFFSWLSHTYITLERKAIPYPCKLIDMRYFMNDIYLEIQYSGLTDKIELNITKVIEQNIFEYFSPSDKKKIFQLAYNKTKLTLTDKYTCPTSGKDMFVLTDLIKQNKMTVDAEQVIKNENILNKLDPKSAYRIGSISANSIYKDILSKLT